MSYINVRLVGGPADGKFVVVPEGVSVYRVAEFPKMELYCTERGNEPISLLVRDHSYVIGAAKRRGQFYEGVWQG